MIDHIKLSIFCQNIIQRLFNHHDFIKCKPLNRNYYSFCHKNIGTKLRFDFRKAMEKRKVIGYHHLEINIFPHYHFNNYKHNGNDFSPIHCIRVIKEILNLAGIEKSEYLNLNIVNIEFGVNIIPVINVKTVIDNILYSTRKKFINPIAKYKYYKISDSTSYKQIKAYAKGFHCQEQLKVPEINPNTFRFEIKSKQSKYIKQLGIRNVCNLLDIKNYYPLMNELVTEWENTLILTTQPNFKKLKAVEVEFIESVNNIKYWSKLITCEINRNKFNRYKKKYNRILKNANSFHYHIESLIKNNFSYYK